MKIKQPLEIINLYNYFLSITYTSVDWIRLFRWLKKELNKRILWKFVFWEELSSRKIYVIILLNILLLIIVHIKNFISGTCNNYKY